MNTNITIHLSPEQLGMLQRGETINLGICLKQDSVPKKRLVSRKIVSLHRMGTNRLTFMTFFRQQIERLRANGNDRTSETYRSAYNKFRAFRQGEDVSVEEIDGAMMAQNTSKDAYLQQFPLQKYAFSIIRANFFKDFYHFWVVFSCFGAIPGVFVRKYCICCRKTYYLLM